jgi:hypothetical protein
MIKPWASRGYSSKSRMAFSPTISQKLSSTDFVTLRSLAAILSIVLRETAYEGVSKIFRTNALKIIKLIIRPIGRHQPQSNSLLHVDTGLTVSSIFEMLPGTLFLSVSDGKQTVVQGSFSEYEGCCAQAEA